MPSRAKKRQRLAKTPPDTEEERDTASTNNSISAATTTTTTTDDKHKIFTTFALSQGITITNVAPSLLPGRGMGLLTTAPIRSGTTIIHVPPKAMLLPRPSNNLSPQAALTSHLLHLSTTSDPRYAACATVWPTRSDFRSSLAWFAPTDRNLDYKHLFPKSLAGAYERLVVDAEHDRTALGREEGDEEFMYHWAIANTRSFSWKPAGAREGRMVICPFLDYMNHCQAGDGCEVKMDSRGYTLVANRNYDTGEEILATYGAHSNDKLLAHYGFTMPGSQDDSISLDEIILAGKHAHKEQRHTLESVGYLGNYSLTPSTNEICFRTQVALRTRLLTSNEWEYYMGSGDDIANDKSEEVKESLCRMIRGHIENMTDMTTKLKQVRDEGKGHTQVLSSILERWRQIQDALQKYIDPFGT
ncbi:SET domain-containing protein [Myriangium duriaei CBS 260.36]|uniref:SET domain-containing protein n=1 Tax=Myriangium duriaei CBS 260.36 TaxID=1168546 RepID=A0A9P4IUV0_9PEZI|nr:SET domain-containing protein [Myriangium duriaei CBS 260.36]